MQEISSLSQFALDIEKLGIVGILTIIAVAFIYLYIKQSKDNADKLSAIHDRLSDLIIKFEKSQERFFQILLERESRHRRSDD